jgi:hypothetical protein
MRASSLDHLGGAGEQRWWDVEAERLLNNCCATRIMSSFR